MVLRDLVGSATVLLKSRVALTRLTGLLGLQGLLGVAVVLRGSSGGYMRFTGFRCGLCSGPSVVCTRFTRLRLLGLSVFLFYGPVES